MVESLFRNFHDLYGSMIQNKGLWLFSVGVFFGATWLCSKRERAHVPREVGFLQSTDYQRRHRVRES